MSARPPLPPPPPSPTWWRRVEDLFRVVARGALKAGERLPPGVRSLAGISLMIGGVFGFLPVLGFWMFPAGVALLSLDVPPLRRRLDRWLGVDAEADDDADARGPRR